MEVEQSIFVLINLWFILGAGCALFYRQNRPQSNLISNIMSLLGSFSGLGLGIYILCHPGVYELVSIAYNPLITFNFRLDTLSALFMLVISIGGIAGAFYSMGYNREYYSRPNFALLNGVGNIFMLSLYWVVTCNNAVGFLTAWEVMSVLSFLLVVFEHERESNQQAGLIYLIMTHVGTAFIFLAFLIMYQQTGSFEFDQWRISGTALPLYLKHILFVLVLIGFGTKVGIIPLHIWLPRAHPVAPSNVSALMSGVMIKTAVYALVRFFFEFLSPIPFEWGIIILVLASLTAVLGILYATIDNNLKRLLAYSSIENMGIILMGVGASMIFHSMNQPTLAAVALVAGLFHLINHSLLKSLLFMGAGSIVSACHTKNIEELGGLIKRMPVTAVLFLVGTVSICALPPFNGFVSEWLIFQSLFMGFGLPMGFARLVFPISIALLALTSALAAACFIKAFGISFLGLPRSPQAEAAKESPRIMLFGMFLLAALCLAFGIAPQMMFAPLTDLASGYFKVDISTQLYGYQWMAIAPLNAVHASISPLTILLLIVIVMGITYLAMRVLFGKIKDTIAPTWDCGFSKLTARTEYSGTAFTKPIRMIFSSIYQSDKVVDTISLSDKHPYFDKIKKYRLMTEPLYDTYLYRPFLTFFYNLSLKLRGLQEGSIHLYLSYILITLILLLVFAR